MKIRLLDEIICRTPAFCLKDTLLDRLEDLKLKIAEASPGFSDFIRPLTKTDLPLVEEKIWFTLWKYFNRAKYRSTPFGSFAAISLAPVSHAPVTPLRLTTEITTVHLIDWSYKDSVSKPFKKNIFPSTKFLNNSSIYEVDDEIRYLRMRDHVHELAAVSAIPELQKIIEICQKKTTCEFICEGLHQKFGLTSEQTIHLLTQLLEIQLLTASLMPNITGADYFDRLDFKLPTASSDYIIGKRLLIEGGFSDKHLHHFPDLVAFLTAHLPLYQSRDLLHFKQQFAKRFEHQEIPLAEIMDPQIGIGYGTATQQFGNSELVDGLKNVDTKNTTTIEYGEFQTFLLQQMIGGKTLKLDEFKGVKTNLEVMLPNTFSVIFHNYKSNPVIFTAGGCSANALLGRFTMGSDEIERLCKAISSIEQRANPEVVFFDVAYQAEKRVDNVNRRKKLYAHELPILSWSTTKEPFAFTDILVSLSGNEIVLKSKSLGKRIIPRIPSAYNYTRSDLAVYRFLCDVQQQGLHTQMSFKIQDFFPGLAEYPRMMFKDIILDAASWRLPSAIHEAMKNDAPQKMELLEKWLSQNKIDFPFKAGTADHTLCFDPANSDDLSAFSTYCKQQAASFYITEALIDLEDAVVDEDGKPYHPQYIATYYHTENIYRGQTQVKKVANKVDRLHPPGGEWPYFEIYCHPSKANNLLQHLLFSLDKFDKKSIKRWFFIRYGDPSPHVRWRLHLKDKHAALRLIQKVKAMIEPALKTGTVSDIKVSTYVREMERYGPSRMELVEDFFHTDSRFVLTLIRKAPSESHLIASALKLVDYFMTIFFPEIDNQISFATHMANGFANEMAIGHDHFKKLNASFNAIKNEIDSLAIAPQKLQQSAYEKTLRTLLLTCEDEIEKHKLLADLIHMHINRVFSVDQRLYETIIYQYLKRYLQIRRARLKH